MAREFLFQSDEFCVVPLICFTSKRSRQDRIILDDYSTNERVDAVVFSA
jgi:hypothetical protein